jgi:hypothetical protein
MEVDTSRWSGDGAFTHLLIDVLKTLSGIRMVRVEDAPASRAEAGYNFISNEIYVVFERRTRREPVRRLGFLPGTRDLTEKAMVMQDLERALEGTDGVGVPDYVDGGMIQYLRTERIIPPYQTRGYKLVELVRLYEGDAA